MSISFSISQNVNIFSAQRLSCIPNTLRWIKLFCDSFYSGTRDKLTNALPEKLNNARLPRCAIQYFITLARLKMCKEVWRIRFLRKQPLNPFLPFGAQGTLLVLILSEAQDIHGRTNHAKRKSGGLLVGFGQDANLVDCFLWNHPVIADSKFVIYFHSREGVIKVGSITQFQFVTKDDLNLLANICLFFLMKLTDRKSPSSSTVQHFVKGTPQDYAYPSFQIGKGGQMVVHSLKLVIHGG